LNKTTSPSTIVPGTTFYNNVTDAVINSTSSQTTIVPGSWINSSVVTPITPVITPIYPSVLPNTTITIPPIATSPIIAITQNQTFIPKHIVVTTIPPITSNISIHQKMSNAVPVTSR
jgi:hypothetical protein